MAMPLVIALALVMPSEAFKMTTVIATGALSTVAYVCGSGSIPNCAIAAAFGLIVIVLDGYNNTSHSGQNVMPTKRSLDHFRHKHYNGTAVANGLPKSWEGHHVWDVAGNTYKKNSVVGKFRNKVTVELASKKHSKRFYNGVINALIMDYNDEATGANAGTVHSQDHSQSAHDMAYQLVQGIQNSHAGTDSFHIRTDSGVELAQGTLQART